MTNDNIIPQMKDAELDSFLDAYNVPEFDEAAMNARLMTAISGDQPVVSTKTGLVWFRPMRFAMAAMIGFFAAVLYLQSGDVMPPSDSSRAVIAGASQNDVMPPVDERTIVASAAWGDAEFEDLFLNEMVDQNLLLTDFRSAPPQTQEPVPAESPQTQPIDDFLDDLLGVESRQL